MSTSTVIGIILLLTYIAFAIYAAKGGNLMLGFFVMAVLWAGLAAIAGVTTWNATAEQAAAGMIDINNGIFQQGPELWGTTAVVIIFGSWFGRILVDTGIARSIIRTAVELGGDRPALTCILLSIVTALIFTSAYGAGSVVAIGVIAFPILLSLGIPKALATASFLMSVGAGLYINNGWLTQIKALIPEFDYTSGPWVPFGFIAFGLQMVATIIMILVFSPKKRVAARHAWAAEANADGERKVNIFAMITPILPVVFSIAFKFKSITAILVSILWAMIFTGQLKKGWKHIGEFLQKTFHDGVVDVALVFAFLFFLQMFLRAAKVCAPLLVPIIKPVIPNSVLPVFIVFGILGVLALFRGPLTVWGAGAAILAMLQSIGGIFTPQILFPLLTIPSTTVNGSICPTQSWCLWAIGYTKAELKEYFKNCLPFALVLTLILEIIAYFMFA